MFFEPMEARRLMSVVAPATLVGITATQSGSGTLHVTANTAGASATVIEAGTRNDSGFIMATGGAGSIAVMDGNGNVEIFNGVSSKPITIQGGSKGTNASFDGLTHVAQVNLGGKAGTTDNIVVLDEGNGGSTVQCNAGTANVSVPFSHNIKIVDGGGTNNIFLNSDFFVDTVVAGNTVTQTDWNESVVVGDTTQDLSTVQVGGGNNFIADYAGNLKLQAGSGYNVLAIQGESGTVTNPPKTFSTQYVDVISQTGVDLLEGT